MAYKLTQYGSIIRLSDGLIIPAEATDQDYVDYLAWVALGNVPTPADLTENQTAQAGVKAWFASHQNAALLFNLSIADLDAEIDLTVDNLFPTASAANKNKMKLWMKTVSHSVRALAKREGFT